MDDFDPNEEYPIDAGINGILHERILKVIETIRENVPNSVEVYTQGGCFQFYKILHSIYSSAKPYYDMDHVITEINDHFYDINGEVFPGENYMLLWEYGPNIYSNTVRLRYAQKE